MTLIFEVMRGGGDNLAYIVGCQKKKKVAVVDPVASHAILEYCRDKKLEILYVLNTHGHPDHTAGNDTIVKATGAKVMAHSEDRPPGVDKTLKDGDEIEVGTRKIKVIHTPGHTSGSVCFQINNKILSGDTLFLAGAGNTRFGGNVGDLFDSITRKIMPLSDKYTVHPGHDYSENNLRFARTLEPENQSIDHKLKELKNASRNGHVVMSTIGEEKKYNPFFRFTEPEVLESIKSEFPEIEESDPKEVFRHIRELRNNW